MIISISSLKGGVGKSTVTINLAVCFAHSGYKICIIDSDINQSSFYFSSIRNEQSEELPKVDVITVTEADMITTIERVNKDYDVIIIDGTPSIDTIASKLILLADLLFVPIGASMLDYNASKKFIDRLNLLEATKGKKTNTYFIINRFKPGTLLGKEFLEFLNENEIKPLQNKIHDRIIYPTIILNGFGVIESSDIKAKAEFQSLYFEILKLINHAR